MLKIWTAVAVAVAVASGCAGESAPVDPSEIAIAAWTAAHGAPTATCAEAARAATFRTLDPSTLATQCQSAQAKACLIRYSADGSDVALLASEQGQSEAVRAHELTHVLFHCAGRGATADNHDHADPVWALLPPE